MKTRFDNFVGTGGLGTGILYELEGSHALGKEESRLGHLLPYKDFCKQHIIFHYATKIFKELNLPTKIHPIGALGNDPQGQSISKLLNETGMICDAISIIEDRPTLFSICQIYADGNCSNITESHSASHLVSPKIINEASQELLSNRSLVLAAPEVPLESRIALLSAGFESNSFNIASFLPTEFIELNQNIFQSINLLAINLEEAKMLSNGLEIKEEIINECKNRLQKQNPDIYISITDGSKGSYGIHHEKTLFLPSIKLKALNTAGAGDAYLSGLIIGLHLNLPFLHKENFSAMHLARLNAALSVKSNDTINFSIDKKMLSELDQDHGNGELFKLWSKFKDV